MKHRIHIALTLSIVAIGGMAPRPAAANPGLLHKHGARPVGVPTMLPGQSAAGAAAATTTSAAPGATATAATTSAIAIAGVAPGSNGCVVVTGGADGSVVIAAEGLPVGGTLAGGGPTVDPGPFPICDMPPPDGRGRGPEGGPQFWHRLHPGAIGGDPGAIDAGIVDSGMVTVDGPPVGIAWGGVHGGLPNRAAGVRTDSLATIRHHGHGPASQAAGVAVSGDDSSGSVVQAGGVADDAAGKAAHDRRSKLTAPGAAGQAAVPSGAMSAPRWRDRLRFAWPTRP